MTTENDGTIRFSTKEMLLKLEGMILAIDAKLDRKVDRDAFATVALKVDAAADKAAFTALESKVNNLLTQVSTQDQINAALN